MKKLLSIIFVSLLFSGNGYAAEWLKKGELIFSSQVTNDFLKNKTVTDLILLKFMYSKPNTTTGYSVQYYLYKPFDDDGSVHVICFVDPKKTTCRLP
jgi:hypothetical protein